jgi:hypothetical protein
VEDAGARVFSFVDFGGEMKVSDVRSGSEADNADGRLKALLERADCTGDRQSNIVQAN